MRSPAGAGNAPSAAIVSALYVTTIFPLARRELHRWRQRARAIADRELRRHALDTLRAERMNAEGAALFAVLGPPRWRGRLVRGLVAYQTMYDYLDTLTEQPASAPAATSEQLHRALTDALTPGQGANDWYALHPTCEDGYLAGLVAACQQTIATLPAFPLVRAAALASARRAIDVQTLNHRPPPDRPTGLRSWGERAAALDGALTWWEHAAGACSTVDLHTLLGLAANPSTSPREVRRAVHYGTALSGLNTLLESLVDRPADRRSGDHSYIAYYRSPGEAARRLAEVATVTLKRGAALRRSKRHVAIAQAMVSMYLAHAEARPARGALVAALPTPLRSLIGLQRLLRVQRYLIES